MKCDSCYNCYFKLSFSMNRDDLLVNVLFQGPRDISIYMEQCGGPLSSFPEEVCVVARKARREIIELLSQVRVTHYYSSEL